MCEEGRDEGEDGWREDGGVGVWGVGWAEVGWVLCFFFNDTATTEIYTLSLHDALPILTLTSFAEALA